MNLIELKNASYRVGEKNLLDNINFTLVEGENWVIFGRNGSGKSLLLQILTGYLRPSEGEIIRFGERHTDIRQIRPIMGTISAAIRENMHPAEKVIEAVISGKFGSIGIYDSYIDSDYASALELLQMTGTESLKDRTFLHLSDGEKERVLIARALMSKPKVLVLDEPCSNLDLRGREDFLHALGAIRRNHPNLSVILVTHHIEEITPDFHKILILKDGRVFCQGTICEILNPSNLSHALEVNVSVFPKNGRFYCFVDE